VGSPPPTGLKGGGEGHPSWGGRGGGRAPAVAAPPPPRPPPVGALAPPGGLRCRCEGVAAFAFFFFLALASGGGPGGGGGGGGGLLWGGRGGGRAPAVAAPPPPRPPPVGALAPPGGLRCRCEGVAAFAFFFFLALASGVARRRGSAAEPPRRDAAAGEGPVPALLLSRLLRDNRRGAGRGGGGGGARAARAAVSLAHHGGGWVRAPGPSCPLPLAPTGRLVARNPSRFIVAPEGRQGMRRQRRVGRDGFVSNFQLVRGRRRGAVHSEPSGIGHRGRSGSSWVLPRGCQMVAVDLHGAARFGACAGQVQPGDARGQRGSGGLRGAPTEPCRASRQHSLQNVDEFA